MLKGVVSAETRGISIHIDEGNSSYFFLCVSRDYTRPPSPLSLLFSFSTRWASELTARPNAPSFILKESILDTAPKLLRKPFDQNVSITYRLECFDGKPFNAKPFDKVSKIPFDGPTEHLSKNFRKNLSVKLSKFLSKFRSCKTFKLIFSIFKLI